MFALEHIDNENLRLSALLIGLFAAAALLLGVAVYWIPERAMQAEMNDFITADVGALMSGYRSEGLPEAIEVVHQLMAAPGASGRYLLQSAGGARLAGNLPPMMPRVGVFEPRRRDVLGRGGYLPDGTYFFVGESTTRVAHTRTLILRSFVAIVGATLLLAIAGGALLSAAFLRRIRAINATCSAVILGRFGERIPVRGSQGQLDRLSANINEMLDRIESLMENLRQVSVDIAHDLRTPLTRLRQRLESARARPATVEEYGTLIDRVMQDCDAILAVFSALLRISQIESGSRLRTFAPVPLIPLLRQVAELFAPVAEDSQQRLTLEIGEHLEVLADRTLLLQMFSNLVENAIRHAGRGATIRIECAGQSGEAHVRIIDSGPGIPALERDKVFRRLYRLERSRSTPGNGLGLALVAAIAKLHHYRIELADAPAPLSQGLCVTLYLPLHTVASAESARDAAAQAPAATAASAAAAPGAISG